MEPLRTRVLSALTAGWALAGCTPSTPPDEATVRPSAPSSLAEPTTPAPTTSPLPAPPTPAPVTSVDVPADCDEPKPFCVAPHTPPNGHQVPPDPATLAFDRHGCLPGSEHAHHCTGMTALDGPRFENGKCCYTMCQGPVPPCGRPLVVDGAARVAPPSPSPDWCVPMAPLDAPDALRQALAAAWRRDGQYEHASVASFSRFALELLAVGAPPALVAEAQRAAADEVIHAQLCFSVAAAYDGLTAGAGPLPLAGFTLRAHLADVAAAAVREGCIGETFAAYVAAQAAERCTVPQVAEILRRIADDELRHAELAWRFVAWAVARGDARVQAAVAEAFTHRPEITDDLPPEVDRAAWQAAGRFDAVSLSAMREAVLREVVAPAAARCRPLGPPAPSSGSPGPDRPGPDRAGGTVHEPPPPGPAHRA